MNDDGGRRIWSGFLQWWGWMKENLWWIFGAASILDTFIYISSTEVNLPLFGYLVGGLIYVLILSFLFYLLLAEEKEGVRFVETPPRVSKQVRGVWRKVVMGALGLLFILPIGYFGYPIYQDIVSQESFRVLVFNLDSSGEEYGVTESIVTQLRSRTDTLNRIGVETPDETITVHEGSERAREIGRAKNADVVVWGWYQTGPADTASATVQFEIIGEPKRLEIPHRGEDLYSTSTPRSFQWEIAGEVEHVVLSILGYAQFGQGAHEEAIDFYDEALEQSPRPEGVPGALYFPQHYLRGLTLLKKARYTGAVESYDQAIEAGEADSSLAMAWTNRGIALQRQGNLQDAVENYDRALEADSSYAEAWYIRGVALVEQSNLPEAIESFDRALEIDPFHARAWSNRGLTLKQQGNLQEAIESYEKAIEADSTYAMAWSNLGAALHHQGNLQKAMENYDRALEADSSLAMAWSNRGYVLQQRGNLQEAMENYDRALEADSTYVGAWTNRGLALQRQGNLQEAIENYDRALESDPSFARAWHNRGIALVKQGNVEEAVDSFDRALKFDSSYVEAWYNRGVALQEQGNLQKAIDSYDRALEVDPFHARAWINRGVALKEQGNLPEAIESFDRALEVDPSYVEAWYNRGAVLYLLDRKDAAEESVDRACELEPTYCGSYPWKEVN